QLGWKEGKVKIRLERGRALLRARLMRRGLELSGLLAGACLAERTATAAMPAAFVRAMAAAAKAFVENQLSKPAASSNTAADLAEGLLKTMMLARLKTVIVVALAASMAIVGLAHSAHRALAETAMPLKPLHQLASPQPPMVLLASELAPAREPS